MVYRVYVRKKEGFNLEALRLCEELKEVLEIPNLRKVEIIHRYDVQGVSAEVFERSKFGVFAEAQVDEVCESLEARGDCLFGIQALEGQFDQRADWACVCIAVMAQVERPVVKYAKLIRLFGDLDEEQVIGIKRYLINPIEAQEASLETYETLEIPFRKVHQPLPLEIFNALSSQELQVFAKTHQLSLELQDLLCMQEYFKAEGREPYLEEIKVIDTYWSDHCRHGTFLTQIESVEFEDPLVQQAYEDYLALRQELSNQKPVSFMDLATIMMRYLRDFQALPNVVFSQEVNACSVKIDVKTPQGIEKWILLFKNETHNHPTEIEPFGGASTCVGGAIRDPLSGRGYVYAMMRLSGCANPLENIQDTLEGKLPQRTIALQSANGASAYGNQIGVATGLVNEIYHQGFLAKHLEMGAVLGAVPEENIRREEPQEGDVIFLIGGKTGRDGCGGASGSSVSLEKDSLQMCGAQVQKGNAPEERKIQRFFRNKEVTRLIKRCNDFGAGGVSVAVCELTEGVEIYLDLLPTKYQGLSPLELAISESQERMAVVVSQQDASKFQTLAHLENLEATRIAKVTGEKRVKMYYHQELVVNLCKEFLNSNGAPKFAKAKVALGQEWARKIEGEFAELYARLDLNLYSQKGLVERFDSSIGAGSVLMPLGGRFQLTPIQAMVHRIPLLQGESETCSLMAWGYNPYILEKNQFVGAYLAVVEAICKLVATGANPQEIYLSFQEYFQTLGESEENWGKPLGALLGAFMAQKELGFCAIGGKDSMSGSFGDLHVPPTLVCVAVGVGDVKQIRSPEFKQVGHRVLWVRPKMRQNGLPHPQSLKALLTWIALHREEILSVSTPTYGGVAQCVLEACVGNSYGFAYAHGLSLESLFGYSYGSFILEVHTELEGLEEFETCVLGEIIPFEALCFEGVEIPLCALARHYTSGLERLYPYVFGGEDSKQITPYEMPHIVTSKEKFASPLVLLPVFVGTNCEYDVAKAFLKAGARVEEFVFNHQSPQDLKESILGFANRLKEAQILFLSGGFSGADEPEGSAKMMTAMLCNPYIQEQIEAMLGRDSLIGGICNGFQALIKLGLVPFGEFRVLKEGDPTLSFNTSYTHCSKIVYTKVCSNLSPWLCEARVGEIYAVPISHTEGRFVASEARLVELEKNGQIMTQYVDLQGNPTKEANPNGSLWGVEGITSKDGRVFGKMGHSERVGQGLYQNVLGNYEMKIFQSGVKYFQ